MISHYWKNFFPRRLQLQIGVIVSFLLIATIGLYAWQITRAQSQNLTRALKDQTAVIAKNIADLSANYVLTEDFASIDALLNKTAEFPDVRSISVMNAQGAIISRVERKPSSAPALQYPPEFMSPPADGKPSAAIVNDRIVVWHPISEGFLFGWVKVEYSMRVITELRNRTWTESLIAAVPVVMACSVLLLLFLNRHIGAVKKITEFAKRLKEQRGEIIPVERSSFEVEQLMSALNQTSFKLHEQTNAINEYSRKLEGLKRQILLILESAGEGILGIDLEARHTFVNPAAARMLGYRADELIGQSIYATWNRTGTTLTPGVEKDFSLLSSEKAGETRPGGDALFLRKDSTFFPVEYTTNVIRENGAVTGMVVTFKDVTERRRAVEALRESEKKYRTLFEDSKDAIIIDTPGDRIIDINPAGVALFGYSSMEEMLSVDIAKDLYKTPHDRELFKQKAASHRYLQDYEVIVRKKTGELLTVLITATPVYDEAGNVSAYQGIFRDVTMDRLLKDQLLQAQKMEAVGRLTGGIAHDFSNILSAIISYVYLLQKKITERDLLTYVNQILVTVERAAHITQGLLAFSRKQIIDPRPIGLNGLVRNVEQLLRQVVGEKVELTTALSGEEVTVTADSGQMEQVLVNFAANARDAMPGGGRLSIETRLITIDADFAKAHGLGKPGAYGVLTVADTGSGMDESTVKKIFEPFFTTKEVGKGTGLGLSIVHGIIQQHNGSIDVDSKPGKGTTFTVYLPAIAPVRRAVVPSHQEALPGGTETILVADDDDEVRKTTRSVLAESGYTVLEAVDGSDAIEKFRKAGRNISLVLLDVVMPRKNGKEAYDEMRKLNPGLPVLFTSGYAANVIEEKGKSLEGKPFISKPVRPEELLKKVRELLDAA
jgi:PAS domain S-box-containing protein